MLKRIIILLIAVSTMSSTFAEGAIAKKGNAPTTATTAKTTSTTGILNELAESSLKEILTEVLQIKEGKIGTIINKFLSNTLHWTWIVRDGSLPENVNGRTQLTNEGAVTVLDSSKLQSATNLSVARTIIHEMAHAFLTLYFQFDPGDAYKDFPDILNDWLTSKDKDYNKIQHEEIERSFLGDIAAALEEFAHNIGINNSDKSVYTDLAWGGLDFENSTQLTSGAKQRIQNRLLAEQLNERIGTVKPVGTQIG